MRAMRRHAARRGKAARRRPARRAGQRGQSGARASSREVGLDARGDVSAARRTVRDREVGPEGSREAVRRAEPGVARQRRMQVPRRPSARERPAVSPAGRRARSGARLGLPRGPRARARRLQARTAGDLRLDELGGRVHPVRGDLCGRQSGQQVRIDDRIGGDEPLVAKDRLYPAGPRSDTTALRAASLPVRPSSARRPRGPPGRGRGAAVRRPRGGRGRTYRSGPAQRRPSPCRGRCRRRSRRRRRPRAAIESTATAAR